MTKTTAFIFLELLTILSIAVNHQNDVYGFMSAVILPVFVILNIISIVLFFFIWRSHLAQEDSGKMSGVSMLGFVISLALNVLIILSNISLAFNQNHHWDFG